METLPPEILEKVSRDFTPQDLSRCCAVSREWRNTFDQDWLWEPHCDPALVEPLDTTPCVVEPGFVSPEGESSTLTPICHWRLAFLKQQHLWKNWKQGKRKAEKIVKLVIDVRRQFLTNTLLVKWCPDRVEVWDVSVIPATLVARTDLEGVDYCSVYGTHGLFVKHKSSVKVFHVDPTKKPVIEMKHEIPLGNQEPCNRNSLGYLNLVKGSIYLYVSDKGSRLNIIDLEEGKKIKTDRCPVVENGIGEATLFEIKSSPTSDHVIVIVYARVPSSHICERFKCYIYSLKQLMFLSGPVHKLWRGIDYFAIHGDYLAVGDAFSFNVYNVITSECLFTEDYNSYIQPHAFNEGFIFAAHDGDDWQGWIGMFSLTKKTVSTILQHHGIQHKKSLTVTNNKFVTVWGDDKGIACDDHTGSYGYVVGVWEASGQTLKRSDIPAIYQSNKAYARHEVSEAFVRGIEEITFEDHDNNDVGVDILPVGLYVYHYW